MSSVSVIIPCYKYGHFLEECVASVLDDQHGVDTRILIIDDASPDDTAEVAKKIGAREAGVEVIVHTSNQGNIATFNEGVMEWADGDYWVLLSADDRLTPGALRRAVDFLDANPNVGFVYGHALWRVDGEPLPAARTEVRGWSVWPSQSWVERRFREAENPIICPEIVVRTSLQRPLGGFDPGLPTAADMELYLRLAAHADVGFIRGVDQAYYRVHGQNLHMTVGPLMDLRQRRSVLEIVLNRYGSKLADTSRLNEMAHRQLAKEALWAAARAYDKGRLRQTEIARRLVGVSGHENEADVDPLLDFASECWPEISHFRTYRTLRSRGRLGPSGYYYMLTQKGRWWLRRRGWRYRGA